MKKIILFLILLHFTSIAFAQEKLVQDIDFDQKKDTIYLDSENKIVCKLSSIKFSKITSMPIYSGAENKVFVSPEGFTLFSTWMRASHLSFFRYNVETKQILLESLTNHDYGTLGSSLCSMDLIKGVFIGQFSYFDENLQYMVTLPTVSEAYDFGEITLEQYSNIVFENYQLVSENFYSAALKKRSLEKSPEEIEEILLKNFSDLFNDNTQLDSLEVYSGIVSQNMVDYITNNPKTLHYKFKRLVNKLHIVTSKDAKLRLYSWDTQLGGTMHFFKNIYQFQTPLGVVTEIPKFEESDAQSYCSAIYMVNINQQDYYLVITNGIFSTSDMRQSVAAYSISSEGKLNPASIFKTKTKLLNNISVDYDFFSVVNRPERPLKLITFNEKRGVLSIPLVKGVKVTSKKLVYKLNGNYLEFSGIQ